MITVTSTSNKIIYVPFGKEGEGYSFALYVNAVTTTGTLTYQWYAGNTLLTGQTGSSFYVKNFLFSTHGTDSVGEYKCIISNGSVTITEGGFKVRQQSLLNSGITNPALPTNEYAQYYSVIDTFVKGGVHIYNNVQLMQESVFNFTRLKYGQLAVVADDNSIQRFYRFNVKDPLSTYTVRLSARIDTLDNAANWRITQLGTGNGATAVAEIDNGSIVGIRVTNGGSGYLDDSTTVIGFSTNSQDHTGGAGTFGDLIIPTFDQNGAILGIDVLDGGTGYTQPPKVVIFSGVVKRTADGFADNCPPWSVGPTQDKDWVERPLLAADVDNETTFIIDNKIVAIGGGGEVIPPDEKTIVIQDGMLSAVPYDQDLNTFNSVKFHDVTTNVVIENTMAIQTYAYATSSTVGRNSLSAINNSEATQGSIGGTTFAFNNVDFNYSVTGFEDTTFPTLTLVRGQSYNFDLTNISSNHPFALRLTNGGSTAPVPGTTNNNVNTGAYNVTITYQVPLDAPSVIYYQCTSHYQMVGTINIVNPGPYNVLEVTANSKKYIPLDLTRANTFLLTLSDASNPIGTYDGFVLINKAPLTSSFDVSLDANTTYQTFIQPDSIKGKIYTITLFVKHLNVMSTLPLKLYTGTVHTDANRIADVFSVTQIPVKWSAGEYPALYTTPANPNYFLGSEDVIMYTTYDAGATWYGFIGGTDLR